MKKPVSILMSFLLLLSLLVTGAHAAGEITSAAVKKDLQATAAYVMNQYLETTQPGSMYMNAQYITPIVKSGIACDALKEKYTADLKAVLDANGGKLLYQGVESAGSYALAIEALEAMGLDAADFKGYNLIAALASASVLDSNPYMLAYALKTVYVHKDTVNQPALEENLIQALTATFKEEDGAAGWDNWGINVDNNGVIIPALAPYYSTNSTVKAQIDKALAYNETQKSQEGYLNWGSANANSTALALEALCAVKDYDGAFSAYEMLKNYQSADTAGAYNYSGEANLYASTGALSGLNQYYEILAEKEAAEQPETPDEPVRPAEKPETPPVVPQPAEPENTLPETGDVGGRMMIIFCTAVTCAAMAVCLKKKENA